MKTLILYYSFTGKTKREAEKLAASLGADLHEITEVKKRNLFTAFIPGCLHAMKRAVPAIRPLETEPAEYDRIYIGAPVWASSPAPAFNAAVMLLPAGKEVGVFLTSGSGDTAKSAEGTKKMITDKGCKVIDYKDIMIK